MKKLQEASAELELAIVKAIDGASLVEKEIQDLSTLSLGDLMSDYDLDYILADKVKHHVEQEYARYENQRMLQSITDVNESVFHNKSSNLKFKKLTNVQVRKLVRHIINEELNS